MQDNLVRAKTLERAAGIIGGVELMAAMLEVTTDQLTQWLTGMTPMPPDVFLKAVDVINDNQVRALRAEQPRA